MQKCATTLCALLLMVFMSGCGGSSTTGTNSTTYAKPANLNLTNINMGGAVKGGAFAAKFSNYSVSTLAGTAGIVGSTDVATPEKPVSFHQPTAITTDGTYLYVADTANNLIRRIDIAAPHTVTTLAGSGVAGYTEGTSTSATFNAPTAITVLENYLYVADTGNNSIRRVELTSKEVTTFAGSTTGLAGAIDSQIPTDARFNQPTGITTDGNYLYIADYGNHTIRMIVIPDSTTTPAAVTTLAGSPGVAGSADGDLSPDLTKSDARFNQPLRLTTDGTFLYVTDFNNRNIRRIDLSNGTVKTIAGISGPIDSAGNITDSTDGTGATARFNQPNGITTDGTYLYVTDSYHNSIRMIADPTGTNYSGKVTTIIPGNIATPGSNDGSGASAKFNTPIGITTDGTALYVVDSQNQTIRMIQSR